MMVSLTSLKFFNMVLSLRHACVYYRVNVCMKNDALLTGGKLVHSHVTRVQIANSTRAISKFRLSCLSRMFFFHVNY